MSQHRNCPSKRSGPAKIMSISQTVWKHFSNAVVEGASGRCCRKKLQRTDPCWNCQMSDIPSDIPHDGSKRWNLYLLWNVETWSLRGRGIPSISFYLWCRRWSVQVQRKLRWKELGGQLVLFLNNSSVDMMRFEKNPKMSLWYTLIGFNFLVLGFNLHLPLSCRRTRDFEKQLERLREAWAKLEEAVEGFDSHRNMLHMLLH